MARVLCWLCAALAGRAWLPSCARPRMASSSAFARCAPLVRTNSWSQRPRLRHCIRLHPSHVSRPAVRPPRTRPLCSALRLTLAGAARACLAVAPAQGVHITCPGVALIAALVALWSDARQFALADAASLPEPQAGQAELQCQTGPATKHLGGNDWAVYACADGRSVVVAAGAPNPASPFFFIIQPDGDGIILYGEGTGDKAATEPAYNALLAMSATDLAELHQQAVAAARQ